MMNCNVKFRMLKMGLSVAFPQVEEKRWVECNGHGCLAVVDKNGKWKCFATGRELIGPAPARAH
jgi:hypothetical protein